MLKNVQQELNRFAKYVIQQSRTNLTKGSNLMALRIILNNSIIV